MAGSSVNVILLFRPATLMVRFSSSVATRVTCSSYPVSEKFSVRDEELLRLFFAVLFLSQQWEELRKSADW